MSDVTDIVCGTDFPESMANEEAGAFKAEHRGKVHWFCSNVCRDAFIKEPEKFLAKPR